MKSDQKFLYRLLCSIILTVIAAGSFYYAWNCFIQVKLSPDTLIGHDILIIVMSVYAFVFCLSFLKMRGFSIGADRKINTVASQVIALLTTDIIEIMVMMAVIRRSDSFGLIISDILILFLVQSVIIPLVSVIMIEIYRKVFPPLSLVEIYGNDKNDIYIKMGNVRYKYFIDERLHYQSENVKEAISEHDAVLISDVPVSERDRLLQYCFDIGKRVYFTPEIADIIVKYTEELKLFDTPLYLSRNDGISKTELFIKRLFDLVFSSIGLAVLSPVFLIVALAIKLEDGGPVFFRQERCTIGSRRFMIIKFRSMIVGAEKDGRPHPAGKHDDRITKVGRIIRTIHVDELPQIINIIKGDMSIVGPRPERVEHVLKYNAELPEFTLRNKVKSGLTGYAQVYGKYNTTALDKLKLDLAYITNYSLLLDLKIIIETVKILFRKENSEGFTEEKAAEIHDADINGSAGNK